MAEIETTVRATRLHCHKEADTPYLYRHSAPYLWTSFFKVDWPSISQGGGNFVSIYTPPLGGDRSQFPNDVKADDDVPIPDGLGTHTLVVDDGGMSDTAQPIVGFIMVLWEEDSTPGDAFAAGFAAYRNAIQQAFNNHIADYGLVVPNAQQIDELRDYVFGEVKKAIKAELNFFEKYFPGTDVDDFLGFQYQVFRFDELQALTTPGRPTQSFSLRVQTKTFEHAYFGSLPLRRDQDYELFGEISARPYRQFRPPGGQGLRDVIDASVRYLKQIDAEVKAVADSLGTELSAPARQTTLCQLEELTRVRRPAARNAIVTAWAEYEAYRNRVERGGQTPTRLGPRQH